MTERIDIPEFIGVKKITGLNAFPLSFHEDEKAIAAHLMERGRLFEKLAGHHYKSYVITESKNYIVASVLTRSLSVMTALRSLGTSRTTRSRSNSAAA